MKTDKPNIIATPNSEIAKKLPKVRAGSILNKSPINFNPANISQPSRVKSPTQLSSHSNSYTRVTSPSSSTSSSFAPRVNSPSSVSAPPAKSRARVDQRNILRPSIGFSQSSSFGLSFDLTRRASSRTSSSGNAPLPSPIQRSQSGKLPNALSRHSLPPSIKKILDDFEKTIPIDDSDDSSAVSISTDASSSTKTSSNNSSVSSDSRNSQETDLSSNIAVEARVNRKILDLEISNKSLLAFNQTLETKVREQGAEIEQLKKNIRLLSSNSPTNITLSEELCTELKESGPIEEESDNQFQRLFSKLDNLIGDAKEALAYTSQVNGGRVLPSTSF